MRRFFNDKRGGDSNAEDLEDLDVEGLTVASKIASSRPTDNSVPSQSLFFSFDFPNKKLLTLPSNFPPTLAQKVLP